MPWPQATSAFVRPVNRSPWRLTEPAASAYCAGEPTKLAGRPQNAVFQLRARGSGLVSAWRSIFDTRNSRYHLGRKRSAQIIRSLVAARAMTGGDAHIRHLLPLLGPQEVQS